MSSITGMSDISDIGDIMDIEAIRDKVADLMTRLDIVAENSTDYQELYQIRTLLAEAAELTK